MSNDNLTPIDMGFADFVAKLISEVFDAVVTSQAEQQEKLMEMQELMLLSEQDFADHLLQQEPFIREVDALLSSYFPLEKSEPIHAIYEGAAYQPKKGHSPEKPAIFETLGIKILKSDLTDEQLNDKAVLKIYRKAAQPLAIQKRNIIAKVIEQGLSNIVVDSGKISAKLTFNTVFATSNDEQSDDKEVSTNSIETRSQSSKTVTPNIIRRNINNLELKQRIAPIQPINRYVGILKPNLNKQVRLTVKQASNKSPQDVDTKSNIFSEVEINFKTIR